MTRRPVLVSRSCRGRFRLLLAALVVGVGVVSAGAVSAGVGPSVTGVDPSIGSAWGGTRVTVRGSGFGGLRRVRFGGRDVPGLEKRSDTEVVVETPPGEPGKVDVVVVVAGPDGTDVASTPGAGAGFTYYTGVGGWRATDPLVFPREQHTATGLKDGRVLVVGGRVGERGPTLDASPEGVEARATSVALFDPVALNGAGGPGEWSVGPKLPTRVGHTATLLGDGRVLVAGGREKNGERPVVSAVYDPDQVRWSPTAPMAQAREGHSATLLGDGTVLVAGGVGVASAEVFNPATNSWTAVPSMGARAFTDGATTAGSDVLTSVSAGFTSADVGSVLAGPNIPAGTTIDQVDAPTSVRLSNTATATGTGLSFTFNTARAGHTATVLLADGSVLVAGGEDATGEPLATAERYIPASPGSPMGSPGHWVAAPRLTAARAGHTATGLGDGRVLVAGGAGPGLLASAELYDPKVGWVQAGPMVTARRFHTATLVDGGKVLVTGGQAPAATTAAELYQPAPPNRPGPGRWEPTASMGSARAGHTATILGGSACARAVPPVCGQVLVVGGDTPRGVVELFDPTPTRPGPTVSQVTPDSGPTVAATVTLTGDNLRGATNVTFGAAPAAAFQVVSNQQITATSPAHTVGGVDITVTTPAGTSAASLTPRFRYGAGAWTPAPASPPTCAHPCGEHQTLTPLDHGRVLLARGDGTAATYDPQTATWTPTTTPMTARRADPNLRGGQTAVAFTATRLGDGRVLVVGGCCDDTRSLVPYVPNAYRSAEIYDPNTRRWQPTNPMRSPRTGHAAVLLADGKVLVVGGGGDDEYAFVSYEAEIFNPYIKDETTGIYGVWNDAGTMEVARSFPTATLFFDKRVLVAGGHGHAPGGGSCAYTEPIEYLCSDEAPQTNVQLYTPPAGPGGGGTWSPAEHLKRPRGYHTATTLADGQVLVAGGHNAGIGNADIRQAEVYDPAAGKWNDVDGPMAAFHSRHTATLLPDGQVLVTGGQPPGQPSAEVYDPATRRWSITTSMGQRRRKHAAVLLGDSAPRCQTQPATQPDPYCGTVLIVGGFNDQIVDLVDGALTALHVQAAEVYTPAPHVDTVTPSQGPTAGGAAVVVSGSGFAGGTRVSFGAVQLKTTPCPASPGPEGCFTVESPTRITAVAPAQPKGPVTVGVTGPGGASELVTPGGPAQQFTYEVSRPPTGVSDLTAQATSAREVTLRFSAPNADGPFAPAALAYVVKQATTPITDEASFAAAPALCDRGICRYPANAVPGPGSPLTLVIGDLAPGATYHYAMRAINDANMAGPISNRAQATTPAQPGTGATKRVPAPASAPAARGPLLVAKAPQAVVRRPTDPPAPSPGRVPVGPPIGAVEADGPVTPAKPTPLALPVGSPAPAESPGSRPWLLIVWVGAAAIGGLGLLGSTLNRRLRK